MIITKIQNERHNRVEIRYRKRFFTIFPPLVVLAANTCTFSQLIPIICAIIRDTPCCKIRILLCLVFYTKDRQSHAIGFPILQDIPLLLSELSINLIARADHACTEFRIQDTPLSPEHKHIKNVRENVIIIRQLFLIVVFCAVCHRYALTSSSL